MNSVLLFPQFDPVIVQLGPLSIRWYALAYITALVVGLGIGLLQAVTQIQEQTLVFVPKIVAVFVVLLLALPFTGAVMSNLMTDIAGRIAAY